jgi:hypothetical protein
MVRIGWVALLAVAVPMVASASGLTAAAMVEKCDSIGITEKGAGPRAEMGITSFLQHEQNATYCREYFDGFLDGWQARFDYSLERAADLTSDAELAEMTEALQLVSPALCSPAQGVAVRRAIQIFRDFVQLHPELEGDSARSVIPRAMADAFPCSTAAGSAFD